MNQPIFEFADILTDTPASQLPSPRKPSDRDELRQRLIEVLPNLEDEIDLDTPLLAIGLNPLSLIGWHRSVAMEALLGTPFPTFQAYKADGKIRFRRLPPMMPCPGYEDMVCGTPTRGGLRCIRCSDIEGEDLWNVA